jgi:dTDP-4-amino-4,6-dideoxygalactose transaminase
MAEALPTAQLAIEGGAPVRRDPMPPRFAIGEAEEAKIAEVIAYYRAEGVDPGYQGDYEERYCQAFAEMHGGGYADAVATGTVSLYVALGALGLPAGSDVLVSPITDPGSISAIILNGLKPKLVDSAPGRFGITAETVGERIGPDTSAIMAVHAAGTALAIDEIVEVCHARGVKVLEDCSQAHGARWKGQPIGTFGDIAAFSTMYRKASIAGPSGGVVYSRERELYRRALALADRGKPRWMEGFDDRDPAQFLMPALNLHTDEISCAIGLASLARLEETRARRYAYLKGVTDGLEEAGGPTQGYGITADDSPFYYPVHVDGARIGTSVEEFARAVMAEGIGLNPHYKYLVEDWPWVHAYLADGFACRNAREARDSHFCLYVNENYGEREVTDTLVAIAKVVEAFEGRARR